MDAVAQDPFLEDSHLKRLTGRSHKSKQIEWLRAEGIPFRINARGHPVVSWEALRGREEAQSDEWTPRVLGG